MLDYVTEWVLYFAFQSCPSSIQKKLPTDFGKFLANVPVLQWAKHFSDLEYERLRHYYGAYGWGSVDLKGEYMVLFGFSTVVRVRAGPYCFTYCTLM